MARPKVSIKHVQIDKANQAVIAAAALGAAVLIFGLFIGRGLSMRIAHQERVIEKKEQAKKTLQENIEARDKIVTAYQAFTATTRNILGGSTEEGQVGANDGDNARIILDALPSKYDFPALATSVEHLLISNGFVVEAIEGIDDEVNQAAVEPSANPQPVEIPIGVSVKETNYQGVMTAIDLFEKSIRPFKLQKMVISGEEADLELELEMITHYQPEKIIGISKETVQ